MVMDEYGGTHVDVHVGLGRWWVRVRRDGEGATVVLEGHKHGQGEG